MDEYMNVYTENERGGSQLPRSTGVNLEEGLNLNFAVWFMAEEYPELEKRGLGVCDTLQETV